MLYAQPFLFHLVLLSLELFDCSDPNPLNICKTAQHFVCFSWTYSLDSIRWVILHAMGALNPFAPSLFSCFYELLCKFSIILSFSYLSRSETGVGGFLTCFSLVFVDILHKSHAYWYKNFTIIWPLSTPPT